ncbi:putative uncharacterized protein [Pseudomonas sp. StFLB209]|uniref:hypothetical protein n=1 Tax=Pseudomonas sp. StFLB209 TaxID=1028989 RepID=UPI0004F8A07B|nr:hypothetical protein [Pseudomonas sp. StFLB209]BAP41320.1 putative uncharacterized protein [Pseudomonas sp. StFLB209]
MIENGLNQQEPATELVQSIQELIRQLRRPGIPIEDVLWTAADIAEYLKLSTYSVERKVTLTPGFPDSVQPCSDGPKALKRWFAGEVIDWTRRHRAKLPKARSSRQSA